MDSSQSEDEKKDWPYAVAYRIIVEKNGKRMETDHLEYCINTEHAMAIAHQGLAAGWKEVAIVDLKSKVR